PPQYDNAIETALSPNRTKFFSEVTGSGSGYWLYDVDGSNRRKILDISSIWTAYDPTWLSDGKHISFLSPKLSPLPWNFTKIGIWLLDLDTKQVRSLSGAKADVWDVDPTWSGDSKTIAFLRADEPITDANAWYGRPHRVATN